MNYTSIGRTTSAIALGIALLATQPAFAQGDTASADTSSEDIIVTAQQANQTQVKRGGEIGILGNKDAANVPFTIKAYNEALILNQQPQTLGQVLENDPSVRTSYGFGNAAEQFVIRGFVLYGDDVGLNGLYGIAPRQLIAPELYDQVQVLNGASAFINGAAPGGSGLGGSVNLITKRELDSDLNRMTLNYASDAHFGGSVDVSRRFGDDDAFGVRINGVARRGDVSINDEFRSTYTIGGAFDWHTDNLRVSLDLGYQRVHVRGLRPKVTVSTTTIPAVPRADANYAQPWTYTKLRDIFGIARVEYDLSENAMVYASYGARDGKENGIYGGITVNDVVTGAATGNALFVPRTDNNEALQTGIRIKLATSGVTNEFNLGGSVTWQVNRNAYNFLYGPEFAGFATNLYNTTVVPVPSSSLTGGNLSDPFPISRTRTASLFASDTIGLWDDRLLIIAGLRLQQVKAIGYSYVDGSIASQYKKDAVTPAVGIVLKPVEGVSFYANRMEGFEKPDPAPTEINALPVSNAGALFTPVKTKQYEAGAKYSSPRINASIALFQIDRPRPSGIPDPTDPGSVIYGLFGEQRNRGIEFSADGEPVQGLRLIAGGSVIDARLRRTLDGLNQGNKAAGVPDYLLNANVEWDVPFLPGATVTGRVVRTGKQAANDANTATLPAWTRFDLGARYVLAVADKPLTLRVSVDNVANKRYWASAFDTFRPDLLQGAPRTYKASASIDF